MEIIEDFDRAIKVMKKDAGDNPELLKKIEELEKTRPELIKAVLTKNHKKAMEILEKAFEIEHEIHDTLESKALPKKEVEMESKAKPQKPTKSAVEIPVEEEFVLPEKPQPLVKPVRKEIKHKPKSIKKKPLPSEEFSVSGKEAALLIPKPLETPKPKKVSEELLSLDEYAKKSLEITKKAFAHPVREMSEEEKRKLEEWNKKRLHEIEEEFRRIAEECERIKANWKNIEDLKGNYTEIANQVKEVRKEVERLLREKERLHRRIKNIKKRIDDLHLKKKQEFGLTKDAYKYFWNELLMVSVKLVEIEELLEKNEQVTDIDLLELKKSVEALEKKLGTISWAAKKKALATSKVRLTKTSKTRQARIKSKHR